MGTRRILYVTQGSLTVMAGDPLRPLEQFADSDAGLRRFAGYLEADPDVPSEILLDVIEEVFAAESAPRLGIRDRQALLRRRARRKFPRTPYRLATYAPSGGRNGEAAAVCSAVTNRELLDPWLELIASYQVPLAGIRSVASFGRTFVKRLFKTEGAVLLLTHHQGDKLRQIFLRDGHVRSARLSQSPPSASPDYPAAVYNEIDRSRRYLERSRLLGNMEELNVGLVADTEVLAEIERLAVTDVPLSFQVLDPAAAARRLGFRGELEEDRHETLFAAHALRTRPRAGYARSGENRYYRMHGLRRSLVGAAMAVSIVCSTLAGAFLADTWLLAERGKHADAQIAQLTSALRRDNARYAPINADSHEMKLAVDTGDYLLANRVPAAWVLQQLGGVLGDFPDVQVMELEWTTNGADEQTVADVRRQRGAPLTVRPLTTLDATLEAVFPDHDGDMRSAFARIDALARAFESRSEFDRVDVLRYPLDSSPAAAIAGEITQGARADGARFRLGLSRVVVEEDKGNDGV